MNAQPNINTLHDPVTQFTNIQSAQIWIWVTRDSSWQSHVTTCWSDYVMGKAQGISIGLNRTSGVEQTPSQLHHHNIKLNKKPSQNI